MREIKFRAYLKNENKIVDVDEIDLFTKLIIGHKYYEDTRFYNKYFEDIELMQYTGFKDKDDKEIYEGDIIEVSTNIDEEEITIYSVYWNDSALQYCLKTIQGTNYDDVLADLSPSSVKVISNIYEKKSY